MVRMAERSNLVEEAAGSKLSDTQKNTKDFIMAREKTARRRVGTKEAGIPRKK